MNHKSIGFFYYSLVVTRTCQLW